VRQNEGVARIIYIFDERGREIERAFFGVSGERVLHRNGYAGYRQKYSDRGDAIE
jgi:hypothetical protein